MLMFFFLMGVYARAEPLWSQFLIFLSSGHGIESICAYSWSLFFSNVFDWVMFAMEFVSSWMAEG